MFDGITNDCAAAHARTVRELIQSLELVDLEDDACRDFSEFVLAHGLSMSRFGCEYSIVQLYKTPPPSIGDNSERKGRKSPIPVPEIKVVAALYCFSSRCPLDKTYVFGECQTSGIQRTLEQRHWSRVDAS